jgi:hypothetical protein
MGHGRKGMKLKSGFSITNPDEEFVPILKLRKAEILALPPPLPFYQEKG